MKICTYCKAEVLDNVTKCSNCGSVEFENKCNKCGTVFSTRFCPSCGNEAGEQAKTCPKCGEKCFDLYCPQCGTDLSGRTMPVDTGRHEYASTYINISNDSFPPFPQVVSPEPLRKKKSKAPLIVTLCLLGFAFIVAIVLIFALTDMDKEVHRVTKEGHPLYYGSINDATAFFYGVDEVMIKQKGDQEMPINERLIITSEYPDSDVIGDIYFDFSALVDNEKYSVDDMLNIICDYIPFDVINQYYTYKTSFMEESPDGDFVGYYYVMKLNKKGKALKSDIYEDTFAFKILRDKNYNWEMEISKKSEEGVGYPQKEWNVGKLEDKLK